MKNQLSGKEETPSFHKGQETGPCLGIAQRPVCLRQTKGRTMGEVESVRLRVLDREEMLIFQRQWGPGGGGEQVAT